MKRLKAISLFTGAAGLDLGFEAAGFETAVALEMDATCVATLRHNRSWPVIDQDISAVTTARLLSTAGLKVGEADVLIGGPPCQPFSKSGFWASGQSRRLDDPRATTIDHYLRILADAQPRAFLLENVEGFGFKGKDEGLLRIHQALHEINATNGTKYGASVAVLNAADFGVPQVRKRLFVVGARDGKPFAFPTPTHADPDLQICGMPEWLTAWDAFYGLPKQSDPALSPRGKWAMLLPTIPEGMNYLHHTERGEGEPLFGWRRRYWSFLLKLAKNQPSWTLQAQPGPATGPFHWANRRLSMREMARLQTVPDTFDIIGHIGETQKQLGNAVPSLLGEVLARSIKKQLLGLPRTRLTPKLRIHEASRPIPLPERCHPLPSHFISLSGTHLAHPGTGKGYRALRRLTAIAAE